MENNLYDGKRKINWYIVNIDRKKFDILLIMIKE